MRFRTLTLATCLFLTCGFVRLVSADEGDAPIRQEGPEDEETSQKENEDGVEEGRDDRDPIEIRTIEVEEKAPDSEAEDQKTATRTQTIEREALEKQNATTLEEALEFESGGLTQSGGGGGTNRGAVIDGLPPGQVVVLKDGLPIRRATGTRNGPITDLSSINLAPEQIERIEIYRGLGPAGTGTEGGVIINIITRETSNEVRATARAVGGATPDQFWERSGNASLSLPLGSNWSLRAGGTYDRSRALDVNRDRVYDVPDNLNWNADLEAHWTPSERDRLTARTNVAFNRVDALGNRDAALFTRTETTTAHASVLGEWRISDRVEFKHSSDVAYTDHEFFKVVRDNGFERPKADTEHLETTNRLVGTYLFDEHDLALEFDSQAEHIERTGETGRLPSRQRGHIGLGVSETWYATRSLELSARLVGDYHSDFGFDAVGSIAGHVDLSDSLAIRADLSRTRRVPTAEELFMFFDHSEVGYQIDGNPSLTPETLYSGTFGIVFDRADTPLSLDIEGFYHRITDMIEPVGAATSPETDEAQLFTYANIGQAHTAGANTTVELEDAFWRLDLAGNYTYLPLAENRQTDERLDLRAEHTGRVEISQQWLSDRLEVWTDLEGRSRQTVPAESPAAPGYALLGMGARYELFQDPSTDLQLDADNLFNQTNATWGPAPGFAIFATVKVRYNGGD